MKICAQTAGVSMVIIRSPQFVVENLRWTVRLLGGR